MALGSSEHMIKVTEGEFEERDGEALELTEYELFRDKMNDRWVLIQKEPFDIIQTDDNKTVLQNKASKMMKEKAPARLYVFKSRSQDFDVWEYGMARDEYES